LIRYPSDLVSALFSICSTCHYTSRTMILTLLTLHSSGMATVRSLYNQRLRVLLKAIDTLNYELLMTSYWSGHKKKSRKKLKTTNFLVSLKPLCLVCVYYFLVCNYTSGRPSDNSIRVDRRDKSEGVVSALYRHFINDAALLTTGKVYESTAACHMSSRM
jgi:hypothetical protein